MEDLISDLTRGNVTEVKVVLASVVMGLACYQLALIAVGYGKLRLSFLAARPASRTHRAVGDAIVVVTITVAVMCLSYFELEDDASAHAIAAAALLVVLAVKIAVIRWLHGLSRFLPVLGLSVWILFAITFGTSAGDFLVNR
jgi:small-conductance mechanosensitive channel